LGIESEADLWGHYGWQTEEMFRDFKKGGYDLERTKLIGHRLISLILLITLA
jgi:hypothetical protein